VRDVHPTHYGRICPIETPEGPNIGLINSLRHLCAGEQIRLIESPYRRIKDGKVTPEVIYLSAMEEAKYAIAQANVPPSTRGAASRTKSSPAAKAETSCYCRPTASEFMDVSPKQLVSVAAALIPFLENDDAKPRLDGLEHAAPSGAAAPVRGGRSWAPAWRAWSHATPARRLPHGATAWSIRWTRRVSSFAATERDRRYQAGRRHLWLQKFQRFESIDLHHATSAGEGGRSRQSR